MARRKKPENADLPPGVWRKRGRLYVVTKDADGKRTEHAAGATLRDAWATMRRLGIDAADLNRYDMPSTFPQSLWRSAKRNARNKGVPFDLSVQAVEAMIEAAGGRCPIAGARFDYRRRQSERFRPWAPSIDRIKRDLGYVDGNCRIVCAYINLAMNEFGEDVFMAIARYVGRRKKRRIADVPAKPEQVADIPTSRKP